MNQDVVINLVMNAMTLAFKVAMPLLGVALVLGLAVSIVQAVTQIQEQTLSFIPKIIGLAVVIVVAGPWMLGQIVSYTAELYASIPYLGGRQLSEPSSLLRIFVPWTTELTAETINLDLLFVLVDGWNLVTKSLVESFHV